MAETRRRSPGSIRQRRPQARAQLTRQRLLQAAEQLFSSQGYDPTSIADIAERSGVSVGTLYHHFDDKRALLLALIEDWSDRELERGRATFGAVRLSGLDVRAAIRAFLAARYRSLREDGGLTLVLLALGERDSEIRSRIARLHQLAAERIRDLIVSLQEQGSVRPDVDPIPAALLIRHAVRGAATEVLVNRLPEADPERVLDALTDMICRYLLMDATR